MNPTVNQLRLITYNVRSIQRPERLTDFENAVNNDAVKFDVLGLSETWRRGRETTRFSSGYVLHSSGADPTTRPIGTGVGFYVSASVDRQIEGIRFISDRIIQLVLNVRGRRKLRITQVYAPHSGHDDDEYDAFLEQLTSALNGRSFTHDYVIGDFNAIVGPAQRGDRCCGKHGLGDRNDRGEQLVNFCEAAGLFIANGLFKKRPKRRWTWLSPDAQTANEIDYVLTRHRAPIADVSVLSRSIFSSDHRPLRANIRLPHARRFAPAKPRPLPPTFDRLHLQTAMAVFAHQLPDDAPLSAFIQAMYAAQQEAARRPEPVPRISDRTRHLLARRSRLQPQPGAPPATRLQYTIACKAARWSLT
uniref:Endonuclease/exonuclease/phosphatase domain-containing protein n=1 Tax=Plectus sambesii TaxID=2011161 RepID=A0A914WBE4_9BILA